MKLFSRSRSQGLSPQARANLVSSVNRSERDAKSALKKAERYGNTEEATFQRTQLSIARENKRLLNG